MGRLIFLGFSFISISILLLVHCMLLRILCNMYSVISNCLAISRPIYKWKLLINERLEFQVCLIIFHSTDATFQISNPSAGEEDGKSVRFDGKIRRLPVTGLRGG